MQIISIAFVNKLMQNFWFHLHMLHWAIYGRLVSVENAFHQIIPTAVPTNLLVLNFTHPIQIDAMESKTIPYCYEISFMAY